MKIDRDRQLLEALSRREATAAERLIATYDDRAYRLAIGITGNQQDAEEAVQDAFWAIVRKIDTFRGESSLGSWIYRITANAAYQKRGGSAHRRDEISPDEVLPCFDDNGHHADSSGDWFTKIDDPAMRTERRRVLVSALDDLPAHYRALIVRNDVEGLAMVEAAEWLGITVATARTRAHRARLLLRQRLRIFMSEATSPVEVASPSWQAQSRPRFRHLHVSRSSFHRRCTLRMGPGQPERTSHASSKSGSRGQVA